MTDLLGLKCKTCGEYKTLYDFWKGAKSCITCSKESWRKRVSENEEKRKQYGAREKEYYDKNIARYLWTRARNRSREEGVEFNIKPEDIEIPDLCPIRLIPMTRHRQKVEGDSYSLDRVDSSLGYVKGNVRVISFRANVAKNDLTIEEVERLLKYMKREI